MGASWVIGSDYDARAVDALRRAAEYNALGNVAALQAHADATGTGSAFARHALAGRHLAVTPQPIPTPPAPRPTQPHSIHQLDWFHTLLPEFRPAFSPVEVMLVADCNYYTASIDALFAGERAILSMTRPHTISSHAISSTRPHLMLSHSIPPDPIPTHVTHPCSGTRAPSPRRLPAPRLARQPLLARGFCPEVELPRRFCATRNGYVRRRRQRACYSDHAQRARCGR